MGQDGCGMLLLLLCWRWGIVHRRRATTGQSRSKDRDVDRGDAGSISFRGKSSMGQAEGFDKLEDDLM